MLHFCGGVAFRVDVADLLELEGTLEGDWEIVSAAEEQGIGRGPVGLGNRLEGVFFLEQGLHFFGNSVQADHKPVQLLGIDGTAQLTHTHGDQGEDGQLGGEGFGRGHPDFGPGMGVGAAVGLPRNARPDHIADAEDMGSAFLGHPNGRKGVGRLS